MNKSLFLGKYVLILVTILSSIGSLNAQAKRIYVEATPLYSYLNIKGEYPFNSKGNEIPRLGSGYAVKFETDINKYLSLSSGISYEFRKNEYSGIVYDTTENIIWAGDPLPYKYNSSNTFQFIGVPITLNINYLSYPKLIIYQTIGFKASFLLSAEYDREEFYENGSIINNSGNITADKSSIIFSISSSIGIRKKISDSLSIKLEPGFYYMVNNFLDYGDYEKKFLDLKIDVGVSYNL